MIWRALARFVAGIHIAYVVFVLFGGLLILVSPEMFFIHPAAIIWAFLTMTLDLGCPLTPWEKNAWIRGGRVPYSEGFLQHHILRTTFSPGHDRRNHVLAGVFVVVFNLVVYSFVLRSVP
jgi:hypothetical protein